MNKTKLLTLRKLLMLLPLAACQTTIQPAIVPPSVVQASPTPGLKVVGGVEPVYLMPLKAPFAARIDTGAEISSIDVSDMRAFERDGEKWITFTVINSQNNEKHLFEKRLLRKTTIRRQENNESRYVVMMDIKIGGDVVSAEFSLADRSKFNYQALIGRNIINGRFMVDPSTENTLY